jgi:hypothetical protein
MRRNPLADKTLNYITPKAQVLGLLFYWNIRHFGLHTELALKRWIIRVYKSQMENGLRVGAYQLELFLILSSSKKREREDVSKRR